MRLGSLELARTVRFGLGLVVPDVMPDRLKTRGPAFSFTLRLERGFRVGGCDVAGVPVDEGVPPDEGVE